MKKGLEMKRYGSSLKSYVMQIPVAKKTTSLYKYFVAKSRVERINYFFKRFISIFPMS